MTKRARKRKKQKSKPPSAPPAKPASRDWLILLAILAVGVILRISYLRELELAPDFAHPLADAAFHDYWARALVTGDWTPPDGSPDPMLATTPYLRPPGYPFFLALLYFIAGPSYVGVRILQMILGMASCVLGFQLGRAMFGRRVGLILAGFMSAYWALIYFEGELQAPALLVFLALSLIHLFRLWHARPTLLRAVACGLLLGLFAVTRPNVLLFLPAVLLWGWWVGRRRRARRDFPMLAVGCIGGLGLVIAPVTIRNYVVASDFVPISSNGAINLYIGNNEQSDGFSVRFPELQELAGMSGWSWFSYERIVRGIELETGRPMKYSDASSYFRHKALDYIRAHPSRALGLVAKRAVLFWGPQEISNNKAVHWERANSATLRHIPGFPVVVSLFLVGLSMLLVDLRWRGGQSRMSAPDSSQRLELSVLVLLFVAAYSCSFLPFLVAARFRVPVTPFLLLFAAYGVYRIGQLAGARDYRRGGSWVAALVVVYLLAGRSFFSYEPDKAWWHTDRGVAYARDARLDLAVVEFESALRAKPGYPDAHLYLAGALAKLGRTDEAIEHYQKTLQARPLNADAREKLGRLLAREDRLDEAAEAYEKALDSGPQSSDTLYELGRTHSQRGRHVQAIEAYRKALSMRPDFVEAHVNLGVALMALGRIDEAIEAYRAAVAINSESPEAHYNLARSLSAQGALDDAVQEYRVALTLRADYVEARINLGVLLRDSGEVDAAIEEFRNALNIDPNRFEARYNLASALAARGRIDAAIEELEAALRISPDRVEVLRTLEALRAQRSRTAEPPAPGG